MVSDIWKKIILFLLGIVLGAGGMLYEVGQYKERIESQTKQIEKLEDAIKEMRSEIGALIREILKH